MALRAATGHENFIFVLKSVKTRISVTVFTQWSIPLAHIVIEFIR
jgi:hypothetical protein